MKKIALLSLAVMAVPAVAMAQDSGSILPGEFSANVGFVSDYIYRGISQTDEKPAVQGGIDWSHDSGVYLGVWGSNVDFGDGDDSTVEIDVYGGWGQSVGALSYDVGFIWYTYPGERGNNFVEGTLGLGYELMDGLEVGAFYAYSPDFFAQTDDAHYLEGSISYGFDVGLPVTLAATAGHQWLSEGTDYWNWTASAAVTVDQFDIGVRYTDTDLSTAECGGDFCDARAIAFVTYAF